MDIKSYKLSKNYTDSFYSYPSTNLFNKEAVTPNSSVNASGPTVSSGNNLSNFISVAPSSEYALRSIERYALYTIDRVYIRTQLISGASTVVTTDASAAYIRVVVSNAKLTVAQLNTGNRFIPYESYKVSIKNLQYSPTPKSYYKPSQIPNGWYQSEDVQGYEADSHYTDTITQSDILSIYDSHVTEFPDYATKTLLGNDQTNTYPIYKYEYKPVVVPGGSALTKTIPKMIIITGTHGEEKAAAISLRNFMDEVVNNWLAKDLLEFVRFNLHIIIVPILNPYGFETHARKNGSGVDLNRNSSFRWETSDSSTPTSQTYKGTAPFSENEAQYFRDIINSNADAIAFYDYHMNGTSGNDYGTMFWHYTEQNSSFRGMEEIMINSKDVIGRITREGQKRFGIPDDSGFIGYISSNTSDSTLAAYAASVGIPSATIECTRRIVGEPKVYSANTLKLCTEFIGNSIINTARQFLG